MYRSQVRLALARLLLRRLPSNDGQASQMECTVDQRREKSQPPLSRLKTIKNSCSGANYKMGLFIVLNESVWKSHIQHPYQSLACETAIHTDFSELFSLKRIYVKYKNAIDCFFRT